MVESTQAILGIAFRANIPTTKSQTFNLIIKHLAANNVQNLRKFNLRFKFTSKSCKILIEI